MSIAEQHDGFWISMRRRRSLRQCNDDGYSGCNMAEMIGESSFVYLYPEDVASAQRLFEAKSHGDSNPSYFRLLRRDGSAIWVDMQGTPLSNATVEFWIS